MSERKGIDELSRRGQLRRFRDLAEAALEAYGLGGARLTFLRYGANVTYRVDLPGRALKEGAPGPYVPNRFLLRILCSGHWEYARGEMTWLAALRRGAGLPVPEPLPAPQGELLARIATPEVPEGRIVSVMRWVKGRRPARGPGLRHFRAWGRMVARLHVFAARWQPPEGFQRYVWDWEGLLGGRGFGCDVEALVASMPGHLQEPWRIVSERARMVMEGLGKGPDAFGMIHADMYPENVLVRGGDVYPIDFEDCGFGLWMWDVALPLCGDPWTDGWARRRDAFLEGYGGVRTLPETQLRHLDLFLAAQYATVVLWATAFLRDQPTRAAEHEAWRDEDAAKLLRYLERHG